MSLNVWKDADSEYKPAKRAREKLAEWQPQMGNRGWNAYGRNKDMSILFPILFGHVNSPHGLIPRQ